MRRALAIGLAIALASVCWSHAAEADPDQSRVITAPTGWLPSTGVITGTAGADNLGALTDSRYDTDIYIGYGFGDLAAVEVGSDTDVHGCLDCTQGTNALVLHRAAFKMGVHQDTWFAGQPALLVSTRITFGGHGDFDRARVTDISFVASRVLGQVRLHAGATLIDAGIGDNYAMGAKLRPLAAIEWTSPQVPKSTLMADFTYLPTFREDHAELEWVGGFGVRYQALSWGSIELDVRARQSEDISNATIMVRVNGVIGDTN